ncbi:MAG: SDR family oxidoreductase [Nitrososphaerota archaeon]
MFAREKLEKYFSLEGKVALVTGAASVEKVPFSEVLRKLGVSEELIKMAEQWQSKDSSTNLGVACAEALAEAGAAVAICDIDEKGLQATKLRLEKLGCKCLALVCDVSDEVQVKGLIEKIISEFGRIDILINNAGIADPKVTGRPMKVHEFKTEWWNRVLAVDLNGVFFCTREAIRVMVEQRYGKIINIASIWGLTGSSSIMPIPAYCTAKGAIVNFTRELALEYAPFGICVNAVCPGFFVTRIGGCDDPEFVAEVLKHIPLKRFGFPDELKGLIIFLASDSSNYLTGQTIVIDGGFLAQ